MKIHLTGPFIPPQPLQSLEAHAELQFESDACESIKIGSLKARPSDCRLRPCMTGRPRQAWAFTNLPSQPTSPLTSLAICLSSTNSRLSGADGSQKVLGGMLLPESEAAGPGGQQWVGGQVNKINPSWAGGAACRLWWRPVCSRDSPRDEATATYRRRRALRGPPNFLGNTYQLSVLCHFQFTTYLLFTIYSLSHTFANGHFRALPIPSKTLLHY